MCVTVFSSAEYDAKYFAWIDLFNPFSHLKR